MITLCCYYDCCIVVHKVLSSGMSKNATTAFEDVSRCGANFCYEDGPVSPANMTMVMLRTMNVSTADVEQKTGTDKNVQMLMGILLGFSILAALILMFLVDPVDAESSEPQESKRTMLIATFKQMMNPYQLLIIPLTLWSGLEMAYWTADFTYVILYDCCISFFLVSSFDFQAFITCSMGVEFIGFVMICYGLTLAVSSITYGYLVKRIGRLPIFLGGAIVSFSILSCMQFLWRPSPDRPEIFFIIAALWGSAHSVWSSLLNSTKDPLTSNLIQD